MIRLTNEQWERIRNHFPEEHIPDGRPGRKPIPTRCVFEAVLWILNTGAQWHMLPQTYPNYKSVHRRFQTWCRDEVLRRVLMDVANELRDKGALDEAECFIDATFVMAKGGGAGIGPTKRGKGMKIMAIVDRHGLPLSVSTHAANHHEVRLVQLCFDFYMIEAKPENLIGDRAYDSDPLDAELRKDGIEMIAPHRCNRSKPPTQDRRRLSRYMRRWLVERFFAWIQWQRRILIRWEYHAHNFLGFVQLACLVILFKQFLDRFWSSNPYSGIRAGPPSRAADIIEPDQLRTRPTLPLTRYLDAFGNMCTRLVAPVGELTISTDALIADSGLPDAVELAARQHEIAELPHDTLVFLLGSRYCETERLMGEAWSRFGTTEPGWPRVQAICDFVHSHV